VIHRPGGYDRLVIEEAPAPVAGPGEVVIEVRAAGVNSSIGSSYLMRRSARRLEDGIEPPEQAAGAPGD
jgi:hypothetical protein